jgi:hypothetical protein
MDDEADLRSFSGGCGIVKRDPTFLEAVYCREQVGKRSAETVKLPYHKAVVRSEERQSLCQAGALPPAAAGMIFKQVPLIDPSGQQRVALQIQHLPIAIGRDTHVADQHVCGNPQLNRFRTVRHSDCLSCMFCAQTSPPNSLLGCPSGNHMFPVSVPDTQ